MENRISSQGHQWGTKRDGSRCAQCRRCPEPQSASPLGRHHLAAGALDLSHIHYTCPQRSQASSLILACCVSNFATESLYGIPQIYCFDTIFRRNSNASTHMPFSTPQDVLQAAEGAVNSAAWMLTELHSPVTPGMSPQISPSSSPWASPLGSPLGSPHVSPARSHMPASLSSPRTPDLAPIAEAAVQRPRPAWDTPRHQKTHAANDTVRPVRASRTPREGLEEQRDARDAEEGDAYHSFRGEALQLTRRWQSAARKATSAFSGRLKTSCLLILWHLSAWSAGFSRFLQCHHLCHPRVLSPCPIIPA